MSWSAEEAPPRNSALRLAGFYVASFAVLGVFMPFWPLWLDQQGCSKSEIAWVLTAMIAARTVAGPLWSQQADAHGCAARLVRRLAFASIVAFAAHGAGSGTLAFALAGIAFGIVYPPMHALVDGLTVAVGQRLGFRYGPVRTWGSLSFLVVNLAAGIWLGTSGGGAASEARVAGLYPLLIVLLTLTWVCALALPRRDAVHRPSEGSAIMKLLRDPSFRWLLLAAGFIQGSHAAYYGYSTLHWIDHGISPGVAGALWAEAVLAEIALFVWFRKAADRWSPRSLLLLGGLGALVRWGVLGATTSVPVLAGAQLLHAVSFGCTHLAAIAYVGRVLPSRLANTGQGLVGAMTGGLFHALGTLVAGRLFEVSWGSMDGVLSFAAMGVLACCGMACAARLAR